MIESSLRTLGRDETVRAAIVSALQAYERRPEHRFTNVRDDVTGPVVDMLHADVDVIRKELANGIRLEFPYRSKVARDFVMSVPEKPDHVWEPQTTKLLLHLSARAGHVVIGGAYFGDQAIIVADSMRGRGVCHAFEADAEQAAMLSRNAELNRLDNVRVNALGLWSDSMTRLRFTGNDALAGTVPADDGIATVTIDEYAETNASGRIDVIMLDLEGGELAVLRGAREQLAHNAPHLVFEVHRSYVDWSNGLTETDIVRYVASFGYTLFAVRDFQSNVDMRGRPIELVPLESAYLEGPPHGFNLVAVKDAEVLSGPGFVITPNVSPKLLFHRDPALHHPSGGL